jgi:serine/threonine protein kinase
MVEGGEGQVLGPFTLLRKLGEGGMAVTYAARERLPLGGERVVAIKRIHPDYAGDGEFRRMFLDEVRLSSQLAHQNICRVYSAGEADGTLYMSMELVEGLDLWRLMQRCGAGGVPVPHALHIVEQVLYGLSAAHSASGPNGEALRLVHRDISPQNILLSKMGEVKVIDFGVAKALTNGAKTAKGVVKGKLLYYSPEQLDGKPLDGRSDLFAVGLVLYELLAKHHPLAGKTDVETVHNYYKMQIEPPSRLQPELPPALDGVVMKALRKEPDGRYASADEMAQALADALFEVYPSYRPNLLRDFVAWAQDGAGPYTMPESRAPSTGGRPKPRVATVVEGGMPADIQAQAALVSGLSRPLTPPPSPFERPSTPAPVGSPAPQAPQGAPSYAGQAAGLGPPKKRRSYWGWYVLIGVLATIAVGCLGFFGLAMLAAMSK